MSKSKIVLFWTICYVLSFVSLILSFPILLFAFYPYSIVVIAIYTIVVAILSVLSFHKSAIKHTAIKPMLVVLVQYKHSSIPCILGIGSYAYFCYNKKVTG